MGAQALRNGSEPATPMDWFDNVTIRDPTVSSAYFYVSGNDTTPEGTFYDTEFVFGGEGNGKSTNFNQLSASLQLFYDNSNKGVLTYFPSYYSFGQDTAESADNLHVSYSGNGVAQVSPGPVNYVYLGSASGTSSLSQLATSSGTTSTTSSVAEFPNGSLGALAFAIVAVVASITRGAGRGPKRSPLAPAQSEAKQLSRGQHTLTSMKLLLKHELPEEAEERASLRYILNASLFLSVDGSKASVMGSIGPQQGKPIAISDREYSSYRVLP